MIGALTAVSDASKMYANLGALIFLLICVAGLSISPSTYMPTALPLTA